MSSDDLYLNYICSFNSKFKNYLKKEKEHHINGSLFILNKDFIDFPEKRGNTNKNMLINNSDGGGFMIDPDKSFFLLDQDTWSKIEKDYPEEFELKVESKIYTSKIYFKIIDLNYYFYFINDNNILSEGYFSFKNKEFAHIIIKYFLEMEIDDFFNEMKIKKTYNTQKIEYNGQYFYIKIKNNDEINKVFDKAIKQNNNKLVIKNFPIDIKIYKFFVYYYYFEKKFKSLLNELKSTNYKSLNVILISEKWLNNMKVKYNYNLVEKILKDKRKNEINSDLIEKLAQKYPLNPQIQDYLPRKQEIEYYLDTDIYYFINYTFIDKKCLDIFKEEIDKNNLEFKERYLCLIKDSIYALIYYEDALEVFLKIDSIILEQYLFILNNKSNTKYIIDLFKSKEYENVFKELSVENRDIDDQKIFDKDKNEIGTMINLLNLNNKKNKQNINKEKESNFIKESKNKLQICENNIPKKLPNINAIERKKILDNNKSKNNLEPLEQNVNTNENKEIKRDFSQKTKNINIKTGNRFKSMNNLKKNKKEKKENNNNNKKININKGSKDNQRSQINKIQSFNINQNDDNNQMSDNNLIGGIDTKEKKIEANQNQNKFNKKINNFVDNKKVHNKQKDNQTKEIINEKEYLNNARGLVNSNNNTCLNSIIECLAHVKDLTEYLLNPIKSQKYLSDKYKLTKEYINILSNIWFNDKINYYSLNDLVKILNEKNFWSKTKNLSALIIFLIETLHNELNKSDKNSEQKQTFVGIEYNFQLVFKYFSESFSQNNRSIISDIFYGMTNYKTKCLNCNSLMHEIQCFYFLEFSLEKVKVFKNKNENLLSIYDCFDYYQKKDYLDNENKIYCNTCKTNSNSANNYELLICPKSLIISLNRVDDNFDIKLYFEEFLDIKKYVNIYQESPSYYELIGIVCNCDFSKENDYFISFCKSFNDFNWYKYDNNKVNLSSFQEASSTGIPYILFYSYINR